MSALVAILGIFIISALGIIAVIVHFLRQRALQERQPRQVKPKRCKRGADVAAEPEPEPLKKGRSRLISAASLAEAEAANTAPDGTMIKPAAAEPAPLPLPVKPSRSLLEAAARQAIVFRQHFPPHLAPDGRSFMSIS